MTIIEKEDSESPEILQLVSFAAGSEEFGADILKIQEINRMARITSIPDTPSFVEGLINLRAKLGLTKKEPGRDSRIIVVELKDKILGFIVESVSEVLRIPRSITEAPPEIASNSINSEYITSIAKLEERLLILLDLEKVLPLKELS